MKQNIQTCAPTHKQTHAHSCVCRCTHAHTQSLMRQMANGWRMNQTVRVIFRCNGAVNDSVVLERYRILHKLQCMYYQLVLETEEFILV